MNNHDSRPFVTYGIAKKMKDKEFIKHSVEIMAFFVEGDHEEKSADFQNISNNADKVMFAAPLWQQATDWLRNVHGIHVHVEYNRTGSVYVGYVDGEEVSSANNYYDALQEALSEAIDKVEI